VDWLIIQTLEDWNSRGWKLVVELHTRAWKRAAAETPLHLHLETHLFRLGQSYFSERCPMLRKKGGNPTHHRPRAVVCVGGLESMGADEWRAGKSGPSALGSLPKSPTGSTSYELLSTDLR